jgi:hypothetical protein
MIGCGIHCVSGVRWVQIFLINIVVGIFFVRYAVAVVHIENIS